LTNIRPATTKLDGPHKAGHDDQDYKSTSVTLPGSIGSPRKISPRRAKRPGASVQRNRDNPAPLASSFFSFRMVSTALAVVSALSMMMTPPNGRF
jgi:hypothetical protein